MKLCMSCHQFALQSELCPVKVLQQPTVLSNLTFTEGQLEPQLTEAAVPSPCSPPVTHHNDYMDVSIVSLMSVYCDPRKHIYTVIMICFSTSHTA